MFSWNERYDTSHYLYGTEPNDFIRENAGEIHSGKVLCLVEGEGRNAVFLAARGFEVTAVDQAETAIAKALRLADERGVAIEALVGDIGNFDFGEAKYSGIVNTFGHLPPALRAKIHRNVVGSLIPGGVYLLEAFSFRQPEMPGVGGPPGGSGLHMDLEVIREELEGLDFEIAREIDRDLNEGVGHRGLCAVIQVLARKH